MIINYSRYPAFILVSWCLGQTSRQITLKAMAIGDDKLLPTAANNSLLVAIHSFYIATMTRVMIATTNVEAKQERNKTMKNAMMTQTTVSKLLMNQFLLMQKLTQIRSHHRSLLQLLCSSPALTELVVNTITSQGIV